MGGGGEYRALIFLKDGQPVAQIRGVIVPHFRRDAQFRAKECGSEFGNQFLSGLSVIAESLRAEIPIQPVFRFRPVGVMPMSA
jgi:hypothetical protein